MTEEIRAVTVDHRGRTLQVHVAPHPADDPDKENPRQFLHVQDLAGGRGRYLDLESAEAQQLVAAHAQIREIGGETRKNREARAERARLEQEAQRREDEANAPRTEQAAAGGGEGQGGSWGG